MITDVEFFYEIFEDFIDIGENPHDNEIWRSNSIIKLMKEMDKKEFIEEGLNAILKLCTIKKDCCLFDLLGSESYSPNTLLGPDRILLKSILKEEFS
ncbi:hypothetical protein LCGC14_0574360 [marine sediment metagenome]|uniref:Uncharacterized protein n=1 Tax=marine sediment metagenome TaxID=412755 RepID=A0A0F9RNB7_9ZZZZ|nr:hypothetical protein [bacterium]